MPLSRALPNKKNHHKVGDHTLSHIRAVTDSGWAVADGSGTATEQLRVHQRRLEGNRRRLGNRFGRSFAREGKGRGDKRALWPLHPEALGALHVNRPWGSRMVSGAVCRPGPGPWLTHCSWDFRPLPKWARRTANTLAPAIASTPAPSHKHRTVKSAMQLAPTS